MNCRKVNHLLSAYMDGELPGVEHRQIREHVLRCAECACEYDGLLRMKRMLAQMCLREPNNDLASRILNQVHQVAEQHTAPRVSGWFRQSSASFKSVLPAPTQLALAASLLFAAGLAITHLNDSSTAVVWQHESADQVNALRLAPTDLLNPANREPNNSEILAPDMLYPTRPRRFLGANTFGASLVPTGDESVTVFMPHH